MSFTLSDGLKLYSWPQLAQKRLSGLTLFLQDGHLHFFSWIRMSAMTIWSGSRKGITGMLTRPPPSARPRPREPLLERLRPRDEPLPALPSLPELPDELELLCVPTEVARGRRVLVDFCW